MKFFTFTALLVAALFSVVATIPFLPATKEHSDTFVVEATVASTAAGHIQVYFDAGAGLSEAASSTLPLVASATPVTYRLPLPPGTYRGLRFDPIDHDGTVTIASLRVVGRGGRVVRTVDLATLVPAHDIQSAQLHNGQLDIVVTPKANDPQLACTFTPPLAVLLTTGEVISGWAPRALGVLAGFALVLLALDRLPRLRDAAAERIRQLATRPGRAVSVVALVAVVASAYPVVFLGKSFVSPNLGTILLYDTYPTLPGYKNGELGDVKGSDIGAIMWQHVPFSMIQHHALAEGELPLWNRYNSAGIPLLGQGQSMFGDPLHLFVIAANGAAWAWDIKYLVAKWLFATGLGLLVLAIVRGPQTVSAPPAASGLRVASDFALPAALLVALAAPFVGFFVYRINHPAFFSVCYAPWPLYCWVRLVHAETRRATALWVAGLVVANLTLMNSGTAKEAYMLLVCMNFSGVCVLVSVDQPWRERLLRFAGVAWAGLICLLLALPVLATFFGSLKNAYTSYDAVSAFQIQPSLLLGLFDELFYRPIMASARTFDPSLNLLLLLGVLYFLATLRVSFACRAAIAVAVSSLLPLALAFGLVPADWVIRVPFLSNVAHLDNTFSCALVVLWSVLAGVGFAQAAARLGTREGKGDLVAAGLMLFGLVFAWIGFRQAVHRSVFGPNTTFSVFQPGQTIPVDGFVWAQLAVLLVASAGLAWVARRSLARGTATPALALAGALCVVAMLWRQGFQAMSLGFETYVSQPTVRVNFHAKSDAMTWVHAEHVREPGRGFGLHGNFFPGWTGAYDLETIHGPDALSSPWLRELVEASGVERLWDWRLYVEPANVAEARPFLDALNVRWYLDLASDQGVLGKALKLVHLGDLDVYASPTAWPRAFFTDRVMLYDRAPEFMQQVRAADGKPLAAVTRDVAAATPAVQALSHDLASRSVAPATHYKLTANTTSFDVHAGGPGVVVLSEVLWTGDFRAEINGQKAPVLRLNHVFKGVAIAAAGDYHIVFRYVPKNWPRNLALCGLGALLGVGSLVLALRRPRVL